MRPFRLVALALVVIGLGAYIYFVERHQPSTDELAERKDKLFPGFAQDKVDDIVVRNSHGRFELKKDGAAWKLVAPLADDANAGAVTSLLSSLGGLKAERTLDDAGSKLAEYGLQKPKLEVTTRDAAGHVDSLKLGSELPLGNTVAALTDGGAVVYLVSKYITSDIDRDLSGWRSTDLVDVYADQVVSLTLKEGGKSLALASATGAWTLTEPLVDLADGTRVQDLLSDLNSAQIKEFVDAPGDATRMGLSPARIEMTIVRKDGKGTLQLAFGTERKVGSASQVACRRGDRVFWVDAGALAHMSPDANDWREKKLVRLETWSAEALRIQAGAAKADLVRKDGIWRSGTEEVNGDPVMQRLRDLADLEVIAFDVPKPSGVAIGSLTVTVSGGAKVEATFYPGSEAGKDLAVVPGRPQAMAVDAGKVSALLADPGALARPKPAPTPTAAPAPGSTPAAKE